MPKVSVIIPTFNRGHIISNAIRSVLNQTHGDFELIIVDDGSMDNTREVVEGFQDRRICYIWQKNQERSVARNTGIQASQGKYISFLDSDDCYLPGKLACQVPILESDPNIGMVLSGWISLAQDENKYQVKNSPWENHPSPEYSLAEWLFSAPVHFCVSLVRKEWLERAGGFDPEIHNAEDLDLWFRMISLGCKTDWAKEHVLLFEQHPHEHRKYHSEFKKVVEKAYRQPDISNRIGLNREQALAELCLISAYYAFLEGLPADGCDYLSKACVYDPELAEREPERIRDLLVSGAWHPQMGDPVRYIHSVFINLPGALGKLKSYERWALARANMAILYRPGETKKEMLDAFYATVRNDPSLALNRGVLAHLARGIFGASK